MQASQDTSQDTSNDRPAQDPASASLLFSEQLLDGRRRQPQLRWGAKPRRVTRRFCMRMARGATHVIPEVDDSVVVRCASGSLWITHDGDPKDIVLDRDQAYQAQREDVMRMHALAPCVVEIEYEGEAQA